MFNGPESAKRQNPPLSPRSGIGQMWGRKFGAILAETHPPANPAPTAAAPPASTPLLRNERRFTERLIRLSDVSMGFPLPS